MTLANQLIVVRRAERRSHPGQAFSALCSGLFWFSLSGTFVGEPGEMKAWILVHELAFDTIPGATAGQQGLQGFCPVCWDAAVGFPGTQHGLSIREDAPLGTRRRLALSGYFKKLLFLCGTRQVVELPWEYIPDDVCTVENKAQAQGWKQWQVRWLYVSDPSSGEHVWILSC